MSARPYDDSLSTEEYVRENCPGFAYIGSVETEDTDSSDLKGSIIDRVFNIELELPRYDFEDRRMLKRTFDRNNWSKSETSSTSDGVFLKYGGESIEMWYVGEDLTTFYSELDPEDVESLKEAIKLAEGIFREGLPVSLENLEEELPGDVGTLADTDNYIDEEAVKAKADKAFRPE